MNDIKLGGWSIIGPVFGSSVEVTDRRRRLLLLLLISVWGALLTSSGSFWAAVLVLPTVLVVLRFAWGKLASLIGWSVLPISLLYLPSQNLPIVDSLEILIVLLFLVLVLGRERVRLTSFAFAHVVLWLIFAATTFISVFAVRGNSGPETISWLNAILPLVLVGVLATLGNSGPEILKALVVAAKPVSFVFFAIAFLEYVFNTSLFGVEFFRSSGWDRRVSGPFPAAEVLGLMFCFLLTLNIYRIRSNHFKSNAGWSLFLDWLSIFACVFGAGLTFFRSAWLSIFVILLMAVFTGPKLSLSSRPLRLATKIWPLLVSGVVLCGVVLWLDGGIILRGIKNMALLDTVADRIDGKNSQDSAGNRSTLLKSAWLMVNDQPWTGVGFGQFPLATRRYIPQNLSAEQFQTVYYANETVGGLVAHNSYAQVAAESGIVALLALLALHLQPLLWAWRIRRDNKNLFALTLMLTAALFITNLTQSTLYYGSSVLIWFVLVFGCLMQLRETVLEFEV